MKTECEIERPKKNRKTLKAQLVIDADSLDIVCTAIGRGREHDFKIYRKRKLHCLDQVSIIAGIVITR